MTKHIRSLQPLDTGETVFQPSSIFVWVSILLAFLASLLPWRHWSGSPDILLVILAFWCAHQAKGVGLLMAFVLGILLDVHDTGILGRHALYYVLVVYVVLLIRGRMLQFSVFAHFFSMLPVFVLAAIPSHLIEAWFAGAWAGWGWLWSGLLTAFLWFVVDFLFKFFSHSTADEHSLE